MFLESPRFPTDVSFEHPGGPGFNTDVQVLESGHEQRNQFWSDGERGQWDVGYNVRELEKATLVMDYFRAIQGRTNGFRYKDWNDFKSVRRTHYDGDGLDPISALDQVISINSTETTSFQLIKNYRNGFLNTKRWITKPVISTVLVAIAGTPLLSSEFNLTVVPVAQAREGHETVGMVTLTPPVTRTTAFTVTITGVTKHARALITHSGANVVVPGDFGAISGVGGMTQLNGLTATVMQVVDSTHFRIDINTVEFSTFTAGGSYAVVQRVTAGFEFDCAVRFDIDQIPLTFVAWEAAGVEVPIVELRV